MATLSSSSTDAQVWDSYDDNAGYLEDDSTTKALKFITACRIILRRRPKRMGQDGKSMDFESLKAEMDTANAWYHANKNKTTGSTRFADLKYTRD